MNTRHDPLLIALYLPQFHPIPENDAAWGAGFTEWHNVVSAKARFAGHRQPQLPGELGFYDLRLDATRAYQIELASGCGIDAFCFYSYWFGRRAVLDTPLTLELESGRDFPICLCWANENWTRAWDGREHDVIIRQDYSAESLSAYCDYLLSVFRHRRYLRVDGRPIFVIYSPEEIPVSVDFPSLLRSRARSNGIGEIHLIATRHSRSHLKTTDYRALGYDQILLFEPNLHDFPAPDAVSAKIKSKLRRWMPAWMFRLIRLRLRGYQTIDYKRMAALLSAREIRADEIPCVFPSWDNSARRSLATIIQNDEPAAFADWLRAEMVKMRGKKVGLSAVFVNAWNEWAEGCHLEPDRDIGQAFLDSVRWARDGM